MKSQVGWESEPVATFVADCGDCLVDVLVRVGQAPNGKYYFRTEDDAGGADEAPDRGYKTRALAEAAAERYAEEHDDGNGEDAETCHQTKLEERAGEPDPKGSFCVYFETALDDAGPRARYATLEQAEAAAELAQMKLEASNPGTNLLCCFVARELVDGEWIATNEEDY